jgi:hypothetical protein
MNLGFRIAALAGIAIGLARVPRADGRAAPSPRTVEGSISMVAVSAASGTVRFQFTIRPLTRVQGVPVNLDLCDPATGAERVASVADPFYDVLKYGQASGKPVSVLYFQFGIKNCVSEVRVTVP